MRWKEIKKDQVESVLKDFLCQTGEFELELEGNELKKIIVTNLAGDQIAIKAYSIDVLIEQKPTKEICRVEWKNKVIFGDNTYPVVGVVEFEDPDKAAEFQVALERDFVGTKCKFDRVEVPA